MNIPKTNDALPFLTTAQMTEVDRLMIEDYGIDLARMMENAGRNLAHLARARFLNGDPRGRRVVVLAGTGGNGGGALVCARCLHSYGAQVQVLATKPDAAFSPVAGQQLGILRRMGALVSPACAFEQIAQPELVIDGLIGYNLRGGPRGAAAALIHWANRLGAPILALDMPSGVDATTGVTCEPAIQAAATMTLALPKAGLKAENVAAYVGELYLADIGVPPQLYAASSLGLTVGHVFARDDIVRLW